MNTVSTIFAAGLFDTGLGRLIIALLRAIALIVLLVGAAKAISSFTAGTPGKGAKIIVGTAFVCVFLFQPTLVEGLINFFSTIVAQVIGSGNEIANDAVKTGTTVPPSGG